MDSERLQELMPWRHPFTGIDRVVEVTPHRRIVTARAVAGDDMVALAHEPGRAVFPGVMLLEGMSQSAAVLFQVSYGALEGERLPLLGYLKAAFTGAARTGDEVDYEVRALKMTSRSGLFEGIARVRGATIATAELAFAVAGRSILDPADRGDVSREGTPE